MVHKCRAQGRPLSDEQIFWLIEHWQESEHIINRLLRYPYWNEHVANWATMNFSDNYLIERRSEVIGCTICNGTPESFQDEDWETLIWAIYFSRASLSDKENMLIEYFSTDIIDSYIDICLRLGLVKPLQHAHNAIV